MKVNRESAKVIIEFDPDEVVGICEICSSFVIDEEYYLNNWLVDTEGVQLCPSCSKDIIVNV